MKHKQMRGRRPPSDGRFITATTDVPHRKVLQVCAQVERAVAYALAEVDSEALSFCVVESVIPWPGVARLLVVVRYLGEAPRQRAIVLAALEARQTELRSRVASSVHRKKTPFLAFSVLLGTE